MSVVQILNENVRLIASTKTWIEGESVQQLEATSKLKGMRVCVGMPDIQPGKGSPSGAAFVSDLIYPHLVGSDGGCGVLFCQTDFPIRRARADRLVQRLDGLDQPWEGDTKAFLAERGVIPTAFDNSLGTPGFSNHFIEVQELVKIFDVDVASELKLDREHLFILVHSGSRGYGESIFMDYAATHGASGLDQGDEATEFMAAHYNAVAWAIANRELCAQRVLERLGASGHRILDICHNSVRPFIHEHCDCWIHRKGAAPADRGPVMIPGSRGDLSFLVQPMPDQTISLDSLAHGAGRKIARKEAQGKLSRLYVNKNNLARNRWGGLVICGDKPLLWEEAPECYKDATTVVDDLVSAGLINIIATFRPLVTFKSSEGAIEEQRQDRIERQIERREARKNR